jgi:DNA-binding NarL/FixJ family response regulator
VDVLIVEDEDGLRESLVEGLGAALGAALVTGVRSAEDAEVLVEVQAPRVVLSDLRLPGKDGVQLLVDVRRRFPSVRFVFMSAHPTAEARSRAAELGIEFLHKPFQLHDCVAAVESALDDEQFSGTIGGVSLVDLLQVLNMGRRTAAVQVTRRGRGGEIHFADGEIVHAAVGKLVGLEAFNELMTWRGGTFSARPTAEAPAHTIRDGFNSILLDAFRVLDEATEGGSELALDDSTDGAPEATAGASSSRSAQPLLDEAPGSVPGCLAAACADLEAGRLLGVAAQEGEPEAYGDLMRSAATALFSSQALLRLDAGLSGGAPRVREVIVLSQNDVDFFQRDPGDAQRVFVVTGSSHGNLGTLVARARGWLRSGTRQARGA